MGYMPIHSAPEIHFCQGLWVNGRHLTLGTPQLVWVPGAGGPRASLFLV